MNSGAIYLSRLHVKMGVNLNHFISVYTPEESKERGHRRLLRRLRMALFIWLFATALLLLYWYLAY